MGLNFFFSDFDPHLIKAKLGAIIAWIIYIYEYICIDREREREREREIR